MYLLKAFNQETNSFLLHFLTTVTLSFIFVLNACALTKSEVKNLKKDNLIPVLGRSADLAGPDLDNNGIRDDIDAYINKTYTNEKERKAAQQFARAMQHIILVDVNDEDAVNEASLLSNYAINCIGDTFNTWKTLDEIKAMTTSTEKRLNAYLNYNSARDGSTSSLPKGDTCE